MIPSSESQPDRTVFAFRGSAGEAVTVIFARKCGHPRLQVTGGCWSVYPHGAKQFSVRLANADAVIVAWAILAGAR